MVEYETIGVISIIVGLISWQIKVVRDDLKEAKDKAEKEHTLIKKELKGLCDKIKKMGF